MAVFTLGLRSSVVHFKVDKQRQWSLHGTVTDKKLVVSKGRWSDHKGIECKLNVTVLAAKNAGNVPIINYSAPGGWARYIEVINDCTY